MEPESKRRVHPLERRPETDVDDDAPPPRREPPVPFRSTPWVWILIAINALVFVAGLIDRDFGGWLRFSAGNQGVAVLLFGQTWRLFTSMFLHANILHIAFNMLALYNLGIGLERLLGHGRFLTVYLLSGLGGSVFSVLFNEPRVLSVGASGAVFGLMGGLMAYFWLNRHVMGDVSRVLRQLVFYLLLNLAIGLTPGSGIDNAAHIGGFLVGALLTAWIGPRLRVVQVVPNSFETAFGGITEPFVRVVDVRQRANRPLRVLMFVGGLWLLLLAARMRFPF
jgi:rhomboid protease GluP